MQWINHLLNNSFLLPLDLTIISLKSETICGVYIINLEGYAHDTNFIEKIFVATKRQQPHINDCEALDQTKAKRYSAVLLEKGGICYIFVVILIPFYL